MTARVVSPRPESVAEYAHADQPGLAALEFARFADPAVDVAACLRRLDGLAAAVEGDTHLALRRVIAIAEGYGGNVEDYKNPANFLLDRVLETRRGVPISLSLLWIEVGRRCGIEVVGVGLPGHFVVYAAGQMCDPFHYGEAIGFDEAASLVASAMGGAPRLDRSWLQPVTSVDLIRRMLNTLESAYEDQGPPQPWVAECLAVL